MVKLLLDNGINAMAVDNGKRTPLIAASDKGHANVIRLLLEGHTGWVMTVASSYDFKLLALGSSDETIRLWDLATGQ